ncbi:MAG: BrnT family toxin [Candidatus Poribacteria bacterium]
MNFIYEFKQTVKAKSVKTYVWSEEKNQLLKSERNISFEEAILHISAGDLLDIIEHTNPEKYQKQRIFVVKMKDYAWLVPFVETEDEIFLKTIIPSRKATKKYLGR